MKLYEGIREVASGRTTVVRCPNCGEMNPAEDDNCFNCNAELIKPASMWRNVSEIFYSPVKAMQRIALTRPLMQGLLLAVLFAVIITMERVFFQLWVFQYIQKDLGRLNNADRATLLDPNYQPYADIFVFNSVLSELISFVVAPLLIFLLARLFFRAQARTDIKSLFSVAGFAQLSNLITMLAYLILLFSPDTLVLPNYFELVRQVAWAALMCLGIKYSTALPWNRVILLTAVLVLAPQLLGGLFPR